MGGLQVQYSGGTEDVMLASGIEDDAAGFSAKLPMAMPMMSGSCGKTGSFQFASVGIMNGPADTMMGFPTGTIFTPYAYFRNVSSCLLRPIWGQRAILRSQQWLLRVEREPEQ